ncbi:MAG: hypothetical protein RBT65_17275 [Methanolobus sp.]|nr:hypothetical protein [Methanolobus sp.]
MKKNGSVAIIVILALTLLSSCASTKFDRTLLQPSGYALSPKLPKLEISGAETVSLGASNQVESSSLLYTIFRREVEKNICESAGIPAGSIQMDLIYHDVEQRPGFTSKNLAVLEFDIRIIDKEKNEVWANTYSGELNDSDSSLAWSLYFSDEAANNATSKLAHLLIEQLKSDLQKDNEKITQWL